MNTGTVERGALIAGISGIALLIVMFFSWFGAPDEVQQFGVETGVEADTTATAWQALSLIDIILFLVGLVAVAYAGIQYTGASVSAPVAMSALTAGAGGLAVLLILYRLIDPPEDASREFGIFLGLIAAAGITYGGYLGMQEEGTSFGAERDRLG